MKLKLDENLGVAAAQILRKAGHDIVTVKNEGMAGAKDAKIFAACQFEHRCLITLDLEFANPITYPPSKHDGIAVLRLPKRPAHRDLLDACQTLVKALESANVIGKLWVVQRSRLREYSGEESTGDE